MHVRKVGSSKYYYSTTALLRVTSASMWRLMMAATRQSCDLIHLGKPQPVNGLAGLLAARLLRRRPLFIDCDDYEAQSNRFSGRWQRRVVQWFEDGLPQYAVGLTTNTRFMEARLARLGIDPSRVVYVPNGIDRERFAELLVRIHAAVGPRVTLLDGVLAMEGPGPGKGGVPREVGVIMGSSDAFSLDAAVCRMLGLQPDDLPTNRVAARAGLLPDGLVIDGRLPSVRDLRLPAITPLVFGPRALHRFLRKHLLQRPVCDAARCVHCGECWKICPAKAIAREARGLGFDYDACIRCYCCVEVCPHGAITARERPAGRVVRRFLR
jgi:Pyruvate/2-oxoacid:ferredoxin oxidoreductase delta subunit